MKYEIGIWAEGLVPSLIEGLRVVQGLRVVPVFLYRYSMKISLKKARSPGTMEGGDRSPGTTGSPSIFVPVQYAN
jgi:hypothetical protein